jgi:hypothetical protein
MQVRGPTCQNPILNGTTDTAPSGKRSLNLQNQTILTLHGRFLGESPKKRDLNLELGSHLQDVGILFN